MRLHAEPSGSQGDAASGMLASKLSLQEGGLEAGGTTLVLASEGPGNVGQLAADLLASTFAAQRIGWLDDDALLPAVGAAGGGRLAMALELYALPGGGAFLLQQRAPAAPGLQRALGERLAAWAADSGFRQVVVLGSLDAALRRDAQLAGSQLRWWAPAATSELRERCTAAGLAPLEAGWFAERAEEEHLLPPWPALVQLRLQQHTGGPAVAAVLIFAAEGENLADAHQLAAAAARVAGLAPGEGGGEPRWVPPQTWQYVFGRAPVIV
eukprot:scaffold5.g755.t1